MAVTRTIDATTSFNAAGAFVFDTSGFTKVNIQLVTPASSISFLTSNDPGAVQGVSDGGSFSAKNFTALTGTNVASATGVTSLATSGDVSFNEFGRFIQLTGTTAAKILISLTNIV